MARGRSNLRRRGKSWVVYFRANGRQHWRSFADRDHGGDSKVSKEAAELFLAQAQADRVRGQYRPPAQTRFADFADEWLRSHPSIDPRTRELYDQRIRDYLNLVLGQLKLSEIEGSIPFARSS
jgi:hypothetical protein